MPASVSTLTRHWGRIPTIGMKTLMSVMRMGATPSRHGL